tara:strand:- start:162 stop:539 length:378 start_codon:yes stop_codon:yes gene_type:complete
MEPLKIHKTSHHPEINFDAETGLLQISGRSLPEQVLTLYKPILKWVDEYTMSQHEETIFTINLDYINSSSSKYLLEILKKLNDYFKKGNKVFVKWYFDAFDEDAEESGEEYEELLDLNFELIQKK